MGGKQTHIRTYRIHYEDFCYFCRETYLESLIGGKLIIIIYYCMLFYELRADAVRLNNYTGHSPAAAEAERGSSVLTPAHYFALDKWCGEETIRIRPNSVAYYHNWRYRR